jgi:phage gp36-like protein
MPEPFVTPTELVYRLGSAEALADFDDNNDGQPDSDVLEEIIADATSMVRSYLHGVFELAAVDPLKSREVKRLTLNVAQAMAAQRRPTHARVDWSEMLKDAKADLVNLRKGLTGLDVEPTPKAANQGGSVRSGNVLDPAPKPRTFDDMGDF